VHALIYAASGIKFSMYTAVNSLKSIFRTRS